MDFITVSGEKTADILVFGLSTCIWCKKAKQLLEDDLKVEFRYIFVDKLGDAEKEEALDLMQKYNPAGGFPTTVINDEKVIVGYRARDIREALGK